MNLGFNDSSRTQSLKSFLLPSWAELLFIFLVSIVLLLLLCHNAVWIAASSDAGVTSQAANEATQPQLEVISDFLSQEVFAKATVFLLWGAVGAIAYTSIGALQHFAWKVKNDVSASKYVQPKNSGVYWLKQTSQYLYFLAIIFLFGFFVLTLLAMILPKCVQWMSTTILSYQDFSQYKYALFAVGATMVCVYVLARLWHAVIYSFRVTFGQA